MSIAASTTDPDALARDSELLSQVLHDVLVEQAGEGLARTVQWLHESTGELRAGDAAAGTALIALLHGLSRGEVELCIPGRAARAAAAPTRASRCSFTPNVRQL